MQDIHIYLAWINIQLDENAKICRSEMTNPYREAIKKNCTTIDLDHCDFWGKILFNSDLFASRGLKISCR